MTTTASEGRRRPSRRLVVVLGLLVAVVVGVAVAVWMALGAVTAYERLSSARTDIGALQTDVTDGNVVGLGERVAGLREDTAEARDALDTIAWRTAEHVPWVGDDVTALRTLVTVVDDLASGPVAQLARAATTLTADALAPVDGRVPLAPLREAAPAVTQGYDGLVAARGSLRSLDTDGVATPITDAVVDLRSQLGGLVGRIELADRLVTLLPTMLGGEETRRYLLLSQNNAEARSLGGIVGAAILVTAQDGRITLRRQVAGNTLGQLPEPVLPVTLEEQSLYSTGLGTYFLNATNTPDYPRAAELAAARWELEFDQPVDGVMSVDPGALALLLRATGPVTAGGIELTSDNAAELLLSEIYQLQPDPAAQDVFFASAAKAVFDRLAAGEADVRVAATSLREAAEQGRLMLWAARPEEQAEISGFPLAGELDGRSAGRPELGLYLFELTSSKLSYYEDVELATRPVCTEEGDTPTGAFDVEVTVSSTVPRGGAARAALAQYVTGSSSPPGTLDTRVLLYAPRGYAFGQVSVDGEPTPVRSVLHEGLYAVAHDASVAPGRSVTISTTVTPLEPPERAARELAVRHTPLARNKQFTQLALSCG